MVLRVRVEPGVDEDAGVGVAVVPCATLVASPELGALALYEVLMRGQVHVGPNGADSGSLPAGDPRRLGGDSRLVPRLEELVHRVAERLGELHVVAGGVLGSLEGGEAAVLDHRAEVAGLVQRDQAGHTGVGVGGSAVEVGPLVLGSAVDVDRVAFDDGLDARDAEVVVDGQAAGDSGAGADTRCRP